VTCTIVPCSKNIFSTSAKITGRPSSCKNL